MSKNKQQLDDQKSSSSTDKKLKDKKLKDHRLLKDRFLEAVANGELGTPENDGIVVTLKEFKAYFSDIKTDYINSFLPAATFEPGQNTVTHTKYLFRMRKGAYLLHPDILAGID